MQHKIRSGDTVKHKPTAETWTVAFANEHDVSPCGWPECFAKVEDCELLKKATDKENHKLLLELAGLPTGDSRGRYARNRLGI